MVLSWIWLTGHIDLNDGTDEGDKVLKEVWAKSRAKAARAREEVMLIQEEMQRTLRFLGWKAQWWRSRVDSRTVNVNQGLQEGLQSYMHKQEHFLRRLEHKWRIMWSVPLEDPMDKEGNSEEDPDNNEEDDEEDDNNIDNEEYRDEESAEGSV
ncbi:hypothetical protein E1B28_000799 [Marasmius oreades]|uniref:Uncharacterized protein n=1 Tax=Marasmius oreades TaxID=181124 RepID=A0A9P7V268_9AGAR|nr:uncharacterized protein E1B28_000799 [Marasmius oreades]KAG7098899.1 hypothetical protein E1B28_000799 [Marasmius oreades]